MVSRHRESRKGGVSSEERGIVEKKDVKKWEEM